MAKRATTSRSKKSTRSNAKSSARTKSAKTSKKKKASTKKSTKSTRPAASKKDSAGEEEVTVDRRRGERRGNGSPDDAATADAGTKLTRRKKVNRRRQIDPTTCERDYSQEEIEFMSALDEYKRANGRMFPTCSEVLEVIRDLGYVKLPASELARYQEQGQTSQSDGPLLDDEPEHEFADEAELAMAGSGAY